MEFLVIGTGRSGTGFISKLLTKNGIKCGHESIYGVPVNFEKYQIKKKKSDYKGDSSWLAVPFIPKIREINPKIKFIHIVRNPIDVIKSFLELDLFNDKNLKTSPYVKLIGTHVKLENKSQVERAISYYIDWVKMIESYDIKDRVVLNLEDLDYDLLSKTLGKDIKPMDTIVNSKRNKKKVVVEREVVEKQIKNSPRFPELKQIAKKYGYEF